MRRGSLVLLSLLASGACNGDALAVDPLSGRGVEAGITVELDRASYAAGDLIAVTLINRTSRPYGFNLCSRHFEKHNGSDWNAMPPEFRLCTLQVQGLPPGEFRTVETDLPADFVPGTYRLLQPMYETGAGAATSAIAISAPFTIQ
jgi:hypothetical protein